MNRNSTTQLWIILASLLMSATALTHAADQTEKQMIGTDGLIRYADVDEMWSAIHEHWDKLDDKADARWTQIDRKTLTDTGGNRDNLIDVVAESYHIEPVQAQQEVDAWATSVYPME